MYNENVQVANMGDKIVDHTSLRKGTVVHSNQSGVTYVYGNMRKNGPITTSYDLEIQWVELRNWVKHGQYTIIKRAEDTNVPDEQENPSEEPQRSDRGIVDGVGREALQEINETGGKQSHVPYRFDLLDAHAMFAVAKVLHEGAEKYGVDNWRKISVESHLNHLLMHVFAYMAGDEQDEHLEHALTRAVMAVGVAFQK